MCKYQSQSPSLFQTFFLDFLILWASTLKCVSSSSPPWWYVNVLQSRNIFLENLGAPFRNVIMKKMGSLYPSLREKAEAAFPVVPVTKHTWPNLRLRTCVIFSSAHSVFTEWIPAVTCFRGAEFHLSPSNSPDQFSQCLESILLAYLIPSNAMFLGWSVALFY